LKSILAATVLLGAMAGAVQGQDTELPSESAAFFWAPAQYGDVLRIRVWPDATLGGDFAVETTGAVNLPLLGAVPVVGRNLEEIRADLVARYTEEAMRNPVVSLTILFPVSVLGEVRAPGLYVFQPTNTLFDAISEAGGLTDRATSDGITLIRDGQETIINVDGTSGFATGDLDLFLRSQDRIVIGRSSISGATVLQIVQTALAVVTLITIINR
jgi:protein involved in polysaccharide export with SLBB domain